MLVHSGVQSPQKDVFRVFNFWEISDDISCVCVFVSVVARLHAELADFGDLVQCENGIVSQSRAISESHVTRKVAELKEQLRPLGLDVVLTRANSIVIFFLCMTLSAVMNLRDHWLTGQLRDIVQKFFSFLSINADPPGRSVRVMRLTWPLDDYERCLDFFRCLQGK